MELVKYEVEEKFKIIGIKEVDGSGKNFYRVLSPNMSIRDVEHQEIADKAKEVWTDEVIAEWANNEPNFQALSESLTNISKEVE